jgi:hypothetical protein
MFVQGCPRCRSKRVQLGFNDPPLILRMLGFNEILCNNCNLEFKGFALPGAVKRMASTREEHAKTKRRAPRYKVSLPSNVSMINVDRLSNGMRYSDELMAQTNVISRVGMSLILPTLKFGDNFCDNPNHRLHVALYLPTGSVNVYVSPVNFAKLDEKDTNWLVGTRITKITDTDRLRLNEYLKTLHDK